MERPMYSFCYQQGRIWPVPLSETRLWSAFVFLTETGTNDKMLAAVSWKSLVISDGLC